MPLAVTHVILTIVLVDLFRDYVMKKHKRYLTMHTLMIAGVAGLLPDIDIPISWVLSVFGKTIGIMQHGGITHTPLLGLIFLIPGFYFWKKKKHKVATYFLVITFGILFHIFLDYFLGGGAYEGVMMLWPLSTQVYKLHLFSGATQLFLALDAFVLLAWLWHEEIKHKIKDFI